MSTEKLERVLLQRENSILGSIYSAGEDEAFTQLLAVSEQARKKNQVPKLIHKIWWQGLEELPEKYTHPLSTWRSINPDWTVIVWSEKSIFLMMEQFFPRYVKMMNDYTYMIQKIDAAKYFFLEVFGGIYSDMDQICINRIEKICDAETEKADIVCSLLTEDKTLIVLSSAFTYKDGPFCNNAFCISKPRAEAWQHIRQVLVKKRVANRLHMKEAQVLNTTGPCVFTAGIRSAIAFEKDLTGSNEIDSIRLLESKFIDPFSIYFKLGKKKEFNDLIDKILEEDEALCISFIASSWTNTKETWYASIMERFIHFNYRNEFKKVSSKDEVKEKSSAEPQAEEISNTQWFKDTVNHSWLGDLRMSEQEKSAVLGQWKSTRNLDTDATEKGSNEETVTT